MIKVLVISTCTYERNGITTVIENLFQAIDKNKIHMDFIAVNRKSEQWFLDMVKANGSQVFVLERSSLKLLKYIFQLKKIAKQYDVIHVHGNSASMTIELLAGKLAGVPLRIAHSHNTTCNVQLLDKVLRPMFYSLCNGRLACGDAAGKWLFDNRDFKVIKNGIDLDKFIFDSALRNEIRKKYNVGDSIVIGHVGRINEQKNQLFLIDVFNQIYKRNKKYCLMLIGNGDYTEKVKQKVKNYGLESVVIFTDAVSNVNEHLSAVDMVAMPSLYEGFPLTLVEEQSNGLYCIVSDRITEKVNLTGNMRFIPIDQGPKLWADEILKFDPLVDRKTFSEQAIGNVRKKGFDIQLTANFLSDYYAKLLKIYNEETRK